jgi:hypothetical protein
MRIHDPYVEHWYELENQDVYPAPGQSWSRFFRNQDELMHSKVTQDLPEACKGVEAIILAVPHEPYMTLEPDDIIKWTGNPFAIVDAFGILSDKKIKRFFELGCEVKALGRGHLKRIKDSTQI